MLFVDISVTFMICLEVCGPFRKLDLLYRKGGRHIIVSQLGPLCSATPSFPWMTRQVLFEEVFESFKSLWKFFRHICITAYSTFEGHLLHWITSQVLFRIVDHRYRKGGREILEVQLCYRKLTF